MNGGETTGCTAAGAISWGRRQQARPKNEVRTPPTKKNPGLREREGRHGAGSVLKGGCAQAIIWRRYYAFILLFVFLLVAGFRCPGGRGGVELLEDVGGEIILAVSIKDDGSHAIAALAGGVHDQAKSAALGLGVDDSADLAEDVFAHPARLLVKAGASGLLEVIDALFERLEVEELAFRGFLAFFALVSGNGLIVGVVEGLFILVGDLLVLFEHGLFFFFQRAGALLERTAGRLSLVVAVEDLLQIDHAELALGRGGKCDQGGQGEAGKGWVRFHKGMHFVCRFGWRGDGEMEAGRTAAAGWVLP